MEKVNLYYHKIKEIGQDGANSTTFLCKDNQLGAVVVVKEISRLSINNTVDDYHKESKILYAHRHPNICEIQWGAECDKNIYLAMPYYKNGSLKNLLDNKILTVKEIIKYSLDILNGLQYIHSRRLLHLDIKPTNILINNSNRALLTDFGLSKMLQDGKDIATIDSVYFSHLVPDVIDGVPIADVKYDIYQFGLTLYRMCNGNIHFKNQIPSARELLKSQIKNGTFPDRTSFRISITKKIKNIVKKCLHIDRTKRYNSVIEIMNDLSKIEKGLEWKLSNNMLSLDQNNHTIKIELINNNNTFSTIGKKINKETLRETRINKYNKIFTTENERNKFIESILEEF